MVVKNDCTYVMPILGGDEVVWYCNLMDRMCVLEGYDKCEAYEEDE